MLLMYEVRCHNLNEQQIFNSPTDLTTQRPQETIKTCLGQHMRETAKYRQTESTRPHIPRTNCDTFHFVFREVNAHLQNTPHSELVTERLYFQTRLATITTVHPDTLGELHL